MSSERAPKTPEFDPDFVQRICERVYREHYLEDTKRPPPAAAKVAERAVSYGRIVRSVLRALKAERVAIPATETARSEP